MNNELLKNQKTVCFVLWGALTASTFIYAILIYTGMMGPYSEGERTHLYYPLLSIAILLSAGSVFYFKKITSQGEIQKLLRSVDLNNPPPISGTIDINAFNNLSDLEKTKFYAFSKIFSQLVICWVLCDLTTILGFVAYNGRILPNANHFWIFFCLGLISLISIVPVFLNDFFEERA